MVSDIEYTAVEIKSRVQSAEWCLQVIEFNNIQDFQKGRLKSNSSNKCEKPIEYIFKGIYIYMCSE